MNKTPPQLKIYRTPEGDVNSEPVRRSFPTTVNCGCLSVRSAARYTMAEGKGKIAYANASLSDFNEFRGTRKCNTARYRSIRVQYADTPPLELVRILDQGKEEWSQYFEYYCAIADLLAIAITWDVKTHDDAIAQYCDENNDLPRGSPRLQVYIPM